MPALRKRRKQATLPFLLLLAAWFCANGPQSLTFDVILWAKGARHFSHQQQLKDEVALLLAGPHAKAVLASVRPAPPSAPSVPASREVVSKRLDLAACRDAGAWLVPSVPQAFAVFDLRADPIDRAEPGLLPPRAGGQA
jgi:hypothetical protein